jgi:excisionase family DNA binding protein
MNETKIESALIDVKVVAAMLDCSARHVVTLAREGRIPQPVRLGRLARWRRDEITSWLAAGCKKAAGAS